MPPNIFIALGAASAGLSVALGAFGAHALKARLDDYAMGIWKTAELYHMVHSLALVALGACLATGVIAGRSGQLAGILFAVGIVLFSGSLYALALSGVTKLGMITPIGGTAFIAAWLAFAWSALRR